MRLVDAYRRLHPMTSDSDESTVHSTQTNETELSPLLGDEALAWIQDRVASAHEGEAHDDLSTTTPPPPPDGLRGRQAAMPPTPPTPEEPATSVVVNDLGLRVGAVPTSPVARRQGHTPAQLGGRWTGVWTTAWEDDEQRMRALSQLVLSGTAGPLDELELALLRGPSEDDMDATEGYMTEWEHDCLGLAGIGQPAFFPASSRWRSPDGRSFLELAAFDGQRHLFYEEDARARLVDHLRDGFRFDNIDAAYAERAAQVCVLRVLADKNRAEPPPLREGFLSFDGAVHVAMLCPHPAWLRILRFACPLGFSARFCDEITTCSHCLTAGWKRNLVRCPTCDTGYFCGDACLRAGHSREACDVHAQLRADREAETDYRVRKAAILLRRALSRRSPSPIRGGEPYDPLEPPRTPPWTIRRSLAADARRARERMTPEDRAQVQAAAAYCRGFRIRDDIPYLRET